MFYSQDILNPRRGKLAVVWLVATGSMKESKRQDKNFRDVISLKVPNTCDEILRYVTNTGPDPKGRFCLYLSSMLMYGTIKVYRRQVSFLLHEALVMFEKMRRYSTVHFDTEAATTGKSRVTLLDPMPPLMSELMEDDWTFVRPLPIRRVGALATPRKRGATEKDKGTPAAKRRSMAEPEIMRDGSTEVSGDTVDMLFADWMEVTLTPSRARIEDITLRDENIELSTRMIEEQEALMQEIGPHHLGPCFSTWEGPITDQPGVDRVARRLQLEGEKIVEDAKKDQDKGAAQEEQLEVQPLAPQVQLEVQAPVIEEQTTEVPEMQMIPRVEETPKRPTQPDDALKKKKDAAELHEQTLPSYAQSTSTSRSEESQIALEPLGRRDLGARPTRIRRLKIDEYIALSKTEIQTQIRTSNLTLRSQTPGADVINVHWWRSIGSISANRALMDVTHRRLLANCHKNLITRHYYADYALEYWDFQRTPRRKLQLRDHSAIEVERVGDTIMSSGLGEISELQSSKHDTSKDSSTKSLLLTPQTAQLQAVSAAATAAAPGLFQDTQLLPIEEEQGLEVLPSTEHVREQGAIKVAPVPEPALFGDEELQIPLRRPGVRVQSLDEEIHLATPPDKRTRKPERVSSYVPPETTPVRGLPRSPEGGGVPVTVHAEVHASPPRKIRKSKAPAKDSVMAASQGFDEPQILPPTEGDSSIRAQEPLSIFSPHLQREEADESESFIPSFISPIKIISTICRAHEETEKEVNILIPGTEVIFEDLLPENATKSEAAHLFFVLLSMHMKRTIRLEQKTPFGTIYVTRL